jgi:hypothetical protein
MAKRKQSVYDKSEVIKLTHRKKVFAKPCPKGGVDHPHYNTRVYATRGEIRNCVCDDCGHTWKQRGPLASDSADSADSDDNPDSSEP